MRRLIALACLLTVALAAPATAQQQLNQYPGGLLDLVQTAVTIGNTSTATSMYSKTVPAMFFQNLRQPFAGGRALHLKMFGTVTTNVASGAVGTTNLGCNFGGTTATISLVNGSALTANLSAVPWTADVWVRQQGTGQIVYGTFNVQSAATTTIPYAATVVGTTALTSPQTLACAWQWASAAATNTVTVNTATLAIDN